MTQAGERQTQVSEYNIYINQIRQTLFDVYIFV